MRSSRYEFSGSNRCSFFSYLAKKVSVLFHIRIQVLGIGLKVESATHEQ